jgi:glycolate oxidase FAD binding subunit
VKYLNYQGQLIRGGGKVVKNAAGFDLAKLMVGSLGSLGVLTEATFKVFPLEEAYSTLAAEYPDINTSLNLIDELSRSTMDFDAIDLVVLDKVFRLNIRIGGPETALRQKITRVCSLHPELVIRESPSHWIETREMTWVPENWLLIWAPVTPIRIPQIEQEFSGHSFMKRYSAAGQILWLATDEHPDRLERLFEKLNLSGLVVKGDSTHNVVGTYPGKNFYRRIKTALDPQGRFREV